jgi:photosystem II stability/assembly factor-like uncharacterized protein
MRQLQFKIEAFLGTNCYFQIILKHIKTRKLTICKSIILISLIIIFGCDKNISESNDSEINGWIKIKSSTSAQLYDVDFVNEKDGWVVGDSGVILRSTDGGESWQRQTCPIEDYLFTVDFIDIKNGWICSRNSILRTTNGGKNWEVIYSKDLDEGRFRDIQFITKRTGFVVGGKGSFGSIGVLIKTEDGGETWQQSSLDNSPTLTHISIADEQNIWICGFGGTILSTSDTGLTWTNGNLNILPAPSLTTIQFVDKYNGWVGSRDDYLGFYLTTDGGDKWIRISEESFQVVCGVLSFYFINKNRGWMCNFPFDRILRTEDAGSIWQYDSEIKQRVNSFHFCGGKTGWAVGDYGGILKCSINTDHD